MLFRKIQHIEKMYAKSWDAGFKDTHIETHTVTTYWFLFLPIIKTKKLLSSNL